MVDIPPEQLVPIEQLTVDGKNPNTMTKEQRDALKRNIQEYGFIMPVITNKDFLVADGEHRLEIARELGMKDVPVRALPITDVNRRILRQVLNKLRGTHDPDKDLEEYKMLMDENELQHLADLTAQDASKLLKLMDTNDNYVDQAFDVDAAYDAPPLAIVGDVWHLGQHTLIVGDSTLDATYATVGHSFHITMTDPPYNVNYNSVARHHPTTASCKGTIMNDNLPDAAYEAFLNGMAQQILKRTLGSIYVCIGAQSLPVLMREMLRGGAHWSTTIIWAKNHFTLTRKDYHSQYECLWYGWKEGNKHTFYAGRTTSDFWEEEPEKRGRKPGSRTDIWRHPKPNASPNHPTTKPLELCRHAILDSTTKGETVFDPFLGSGSTLIACEQTGRICFGIELDTRYASVAIKRWEHYTGKQAERITQRGGATTDG